ncbi:MAG: hypothetical protein AAFV53_10920 [Myxococcota bacterium]
MRLHGGRSSELRAHYLRWEFAPIAAELFRQSPRWASVTLAVAQYWCDEAHDAVHTVIIPSEHVNPGWPTPELRAEEGDDEAAVAVADDANAARWAARQSLWGHRVGPFYGDNYDLIVAFAAYCLPGCHQEMDYSQAYRPYAIARRGPDASMEMEIVGRMVQPEWEDRFLKPSRAGDRPDLPLPTPRTERLRAGESISPEDLLASLESPARLAQGIALGWRLVDAARRQLSGEASADQELYAQVERWLRTLELSP